MRGLRKRCERILRNPRSVSDFVLYNGLKHVRRGSHVIAFSPERPRGIHWAIVKICHQLGFKMTGDLDRPYSLAVLWRDWTTVKEEQVNPSLDPTRTLNF